MSLSGNLADIAIADLLQFVHMSGRSGTLHLEDGGLEAHISFHRGRIVAAWSARAATVSALLAAAGHLDDAGLERAKAYQAAAAPPIALGQALVAAGVVTAEQLREAITRKVEQTVYELIGWTRGTFRFAIDEVRGDNEIALTPGDVIPELDINTQMVLMEALRLFDEAHRAQTVGAPALTAAGPPAPRASTASDLAGGLAPAAAPAGAPPPPASSPAPSVVPAMAVVQMVTRDTALVAALATALRERAPVRQVRLLDAGIPAPGQAAPVVILDCRPGGADAERLRNLRAQRPRAVYVALVAPTSDPAPFYQAGAAAALPAVADAVAACVSTLLATRQAPAAAPEHDLRAGFARLRRIMGEIRGGLLSASMSLNLMAIVADSMERAVLFAVQRHQFVAVGAFGAREDGTPLAATTKGLRLLAAPETPFAQCVADGRARVVQHGEALLPAGLCATLDAPRSGLAALFPVVGSRRIIALVYADHGRRLRSIEDLELVEIAAAQAGLAFENELLRRQLHKHPGVAAR